MDKLLENDQNFIDYGITIHDNEKPLPRNIDSKIFLFYAIGIITTLILYLLFMTILE